jgi:hypothetical protein
MTIQIKQWGDWVQARRAISVGAQYRLDRAWKKSILKEAHYWRKALVQGMTKQAPGGQRFQKLSPLTRAKRRAQGFAGRKALIRTGTMRRSIVVSQRGGTVFVGILRGTKTRDGKDLVNIARVHEEGRIVVIRVTEKMRRYFYAMMRKGGLSTTSRGGKRRKTGGGLARGVLVIKIPARPVFQPVYDHMYRNKGSLSKRMAKRISIATKGEFGLVW